MSMPIILFVDDEPNILDGLRRMLRPLRHEWDVCFAGQGQEALAILAEKNVDVIISDMHMPGMDGTELLRQVGEKYPHIVRIMFSGYAEKKILLRSIRVAHQYLTKPCDTESLIMTVSQSCALQSLLGDMKLRTLITQMKAVPSLPSVYNEMMNELQSPEPAIKRISEIIQQDIGMTIKVLQIVNSALFGLRRNISNISDAIALLGLETLSALVLGIGIFSQFPGQKQEGAIDQLWAHSLSVGRRAKALASRVAPAVATDAFTAGMLHDIGKVVLAVNMPREYSAMQEMVKQGYLTRTEAENQILGIRPSVIGAYLLELWGLPSAIVEAVAFYPHPSAYESKTFSPLTAIHVANTLEEIAENEVLAHPDQYLDTVYLRKLGVLEKLPQWIQYSLGHNFLPV